MVAPWKKELVGDIAEDFKNYPVAGVINISGMPSKQFQQIRKTLRGDVKITVARKKMIQLAMEKAGLKELEEFLEGPVGLVFTELDPFMLQKKIDSCRSKAAAKPGQVVPEDIIVEKGDTGLPAGPVIGEIQQAGINARIEGGTIKVKKDSQVLEAGQEVPEEVAPVLKRLDIKPIEIRLEIKGVYDGDTVYTKDVLRIEPQEIFQKFKDAHQKAFNLAYNTNQYTSQTTPLLLQKAFTDSLNLALNSDIVNEKTLPNYLSKAGAQAKALKALVPEEIKEEAGVDEDEAGEKEEEKKQESSDEKEESEGEEKKKESSEKKEKESSSEEDKKEEAGDKPEKETEGSSEKKNESGSSGQEKKDSNESEEEEENKEQASEETGSEASSEEEKEDKKD